MPQIPRRQFSPAELSLDTHLLLTLWDCVKPTKPLVISCNSIEAIKSLSITPTVDMMAPTNGVLIVPMTTIIYFGYKGILYKIKADIKSLNWSSPSTNINTKLFMFDWLIEISQPINCPSQLMIRKYEVYSDCLPSKCITYDLIELVLEELDFYE